MLTNNLISFVIPCYRSEETIDMVVAEIIDTMAQRSEYDYEIIAVNDCSPDNVYEVLKKLASENSKVKVVNLAKNMGKHAAVMAGYSFVSGEYVVNLDDDYQSPINEVWKLLDLVIKDECDIATAEYVIKKEQLWKRLGSDFNLWISEIMLEKPKGLRFENLSVIKRFVSDEVIKYKNPYPFLEGLYLRVTKRVLTVKMEPRDRADNNTTGFTLLKSISLFANGFTNFSVKPLRASLIIGVLFALMGFVFGIVVVIRKLLDPSIAIGWSSTVAIQLFSNGVIMLLLGIIGEYVGRIFICINDSPQYVIREVINIDDK